MCFALLQLNQGDTPQVHRIAHRRNWNHYHDIIPRWNAIRLAVQPRRGTVVIFTPLQLSKCQPSWQDCVNYVDRGWSHAKMTAAQRFVRKDLSLDFENHSTTHEASDSNIEPNADQLTYSKEQRTVMVFKRHLDAWQKFHIVWVARGIAQVRLFLQETCGCTW